jgi:hypothetical protein
MKVQTYMQNVLLVRELFFVGIIDKQISLETRLYQTNV